MIRLDTSLLTMLYSVRSPSGKEEQISNVIKRLLKRMDVSFNTYGNNIYNIDDPNLPILSAHMDHVMGLDPIISYDFSGDKIVGVGNNNKQTILGADDKNGVSIILYLLAKKYKFNFILSSEEEIGAVGAKFVVEKEVDRFKANKYPYCLVLDRKGSNDIIGFNNEYCVGLDYRLERFSEDLGYKFKCAQGTFSDADVISDYVECVNLSVGYYKPHSNDEYTSITDLDNTIKFVSDVIEMFQYASLPSDRYKNFYSHYKNDYWDSYKNYSCVSSYSYPRVIKTVGKSKNKSKPYVYSNVPKKASSTSGNVVNIKACSAASSGNLIKPERDFSGLVDIHNESKVRYNSTLNHMSDCMEEYWNTAAGCFKLFDPDREDEYTAIVRYVSMSEVSGTVTLSVLYCSAKEPMIPVWFPLQSAIFYNESPGKISIVPYYDMNETIQKDYVLYGDGNFRNVEFDLISQKREELQKFIKAQICLLGARPSYRSYINFANDFEKMYGYPKESDNITNTIYLVDRVSDSDARSCYSQIFEKNRKAIAPMYDVCNDRITSDVQFIPPTYQVPFVFKFMFNSTNGGFIPVIYYDDDKGAWVRLGRSFKSIDVGVIRPRSLLAKFGFAGLSQTTYQGQSCQR